VWPYGASSGPSGEGDPRRKGLSVNSNRSNKTSRQAIRTRKHRANLKAGGCRRLEVTISIHMIEKIREVAKRKKLTMWEAVQDAIEAYVTGHAAGDDRPEPA